MTVRWICQNREYYHGCWHLAVTVVTSTRHASVGACTGYIRTSNTCTYTCVRANFLSSLNQANSGELPLKKAASQKMLIADGENSTIPCQFASHQRFNDRITDGFPVPQTVNFLSMLRTIIVYYYTLRNRMICRNGYIEYNTDTTLLHARWTLLGSSHCLGTVPYSANRNGQSRSFQLIKNCITYIDMHFCYLRSTS